MVICSIDGERMLREYFMCEVERRVKDCFAGIFFDDIDMFLIKKD